MTSFIGANLTKTYSASALQTDGGAPGIGDVFVDETGKRFKFVKFDNGTGNVAAVAGNAAYYYAPASVADSESFRTVTMDATDGLQQCAGVFQSVPADQEYCWIQIWGYATLNTTLASGADGELLAIMTTAGTDGMFTHWEVSGSGVGLVRGPCGTIIDASAKLVFLKCE